MSDIEQAARTLAEAQRRYDLVLLDYEENRCNLLVLKAASGGLSEAHWKLKRAEQAGAEQRIQR